MRYMAVSGVRSPQNLDDIRAAPFIQPTSELVIEVEGNFITIKSPQELEKLIGLLQKAAERFR